MGEKIQLNKDKQIDDALNVTEIPGSYNYLKGNPKDLKIPEFVGLMDQYKDGKITFADVVQKLPKDFAKGALS